MDALLASLGNLLAVFKDPTNVVLLFVVAGQAWFIRTIRKEQREDNDKIVAAVDHMAEAIGSFKNVMSAISGKAV